MSSLVKYEAARHALAEAHRVDEVKDIRDKAVALAAYARQAHDRDMITWASEIKLRAERKVGELLRQTAETGERAGLGRPGKTSSTEEVFRTLKDLGVTYNQSSDWQQLAAIPEPEFEERLRVAQGNPEAMTTAKILRPTATPRGNPFEEETEVWAGVSEWLRTARQLPPEAHLRRVEPCGGLKDALGRHYDNARAYMRVLDRLRQEGWL